MKRMGLLTLLTSFNGLVGRQHQLQSELVRYLVQQDSTYKALEVIKHMETDDKHRILVSSYYQLGHYDTASNYLDSMELQTADDTAYHSLMDELVATQRDSGRQYDSLGADAMGLIDSFSSDTGIAASIAQNILVFKGKAKDFTIAPQEWADTSSKKGTAPKQEEVAKPVLHQNRPNPAENVTTIGYKLPESTNGNIAIYDIRGRKVKQYAVTEGKGTIRVKISDLPKGMLIYRLQTDQYATLSKKMIVQ